jgi:hypothetical protein
MSLTRLVIMIAISCLFYGSTVAQKFSHPGILNSKAELDFIKAKVNADQDPWAAGYKKMMSDKVSSLSYEPRPCESFTFDSCRTALREDGASAYSHALQWYIKGNKANADKAADILTRWAKTTKFKQSCLAVTWGMPRMVLAAELIKHTYNGWSSADQDIFAKWLRDDVWPFASGCESDRSNWDSGGIAMSIEIAIYLDDRGKFNSSVERLKNFIPIYIKSNGCNNESDRDQAHAQMGIGHLAVACEAAWHQGVDAYSFHDNRVFTGYEFTAKYNLGESVSGCDMSTQARGSFHPIYEIPYNHYRNRKKMNMPYTARAVDKVRPEGRDIHMVPWATLTHAELGKLDEPTPEPEITQTIQLQKNWNLISLPIDPSDDDIGDVLAPINGMYTAVHAYDGKEYESYYPGNASSTLKKMPAGRGYWVFMTQAASLQVKGTKADKTIHLSKEQWNLVGYNSTSPMSAAQALASTGGKVTVVYSYDVVSNSYKVVDIFQPGSGYWMFASENVNWTLP